MSFFKSRSKNPTGIKTNTYKSVRINIEKKYPSTIASVIQILCKGFNISGEKKPKKRKKTPPIKKRNNICDSHPCL